MGGGVKGWATTAELDRRLDSLEAGAVVLSAQLDTLRDYATYDRRRLAELGEEVQPTRLTDALGHLLRQPGHGRRGDVGGAVMVTDVAAGDCHARESAVRIVGVRGWESGDWITSMSPTWRGREQKITAVGRHKIQVTNYREGGTTHTRWLPWLPADVRLVRKGVSDAG